MSFSSTVEIADSPEIENNQVASMLPHRVIHSIGHGLRPLSISDLESRDALLRSQISAELWNQEEDGEGCMGKTGHLAVVALHFHCTVTIVCTSLSKLANQPRIFMVVNSRSIRLSAVDRPLPSIHGFVVSKETPIFCVDG